MDLCGPTAGLRDADLNMGIRKLEKIPVPGDHRYLHPGCLGLFRHRSQDIVGLIALSRKDRNAHGRQNLLHQGNLLVKLFRHGLSRSFIGIVHGMAEGGSLQVEGHGQISRLFFLQQFKKNI